MSACNVEDDAPMSVTVFFFQLKCFSFTQKPTCDCFDSSSTVLFPTIAGSIFFNEKALTNTAHNPPLIKW